MLTAIKAKTTRILSVLKTDSALVLVTENGRMKLQPYDDNILRIVYTLQEAFPKDTSPGVVLDRKDIAWSVVEEEARILFRMAGLTVEIIRETGAFRYFDAKGTLLSTEPEHGGKILSPFDSYKTVFDEESVVERIETPDGVKEIGRAHV